MKYLFPLIILAIFLLVACQPKQPKTLTPEETAEYLEKGKAIVQASFKAMSGQLAAAMQEGGVQSAVSYCNLKANPITDSLSQAHQVTISRVSLRPRNSDNMPDDNESEIMADYLRLQSKGKSLQPFIEYTTAGDITLFAPITIISPLCLKCHGEVGTDVIQEDYDLIKSLYPDDEATGYTMNEFRGLWKVAFN